MSLFEINYSKINAYLYCPYLYQFSYIERKYHPHTPGSSLGVSLHRTLKRYADEKCDLEGLLMAYEETWENSGYETPKQMMEFYNKGRKMLENFWLSEQEKDGKIFFSEKFFSFVLKDLEVKGTIDRVDKRRDGKFEIIEYKTGAAVSQGYEKLLSDSLQMDIYALGLNKAFSIKPEFKTIYAVSTGEIFSMPYDGDVYERTENFLVKTALEIRNLDLSRKGNCSNCQIKTLCKNSDFHQKKSVNLE